MDNWQEQHCKCNVNKCKTCYHQFVLYSVTSVVDGTFQELDKVGHWRRRRVRDGVGRCVEHKPHEL